MDLVIGSERANLLQNSIQKELAVKGYSPEDDAVMAEYITIMLLNDKPPDQVTIELTELISDYDSTFTDWLFQQKNNPRPGQILSAAKSHPSESSEPDGRRNVFQQAISSATGSKRSASKRSPSPSSDGPPAKRRVSDLPDRPRAMRDDTPNTSTQNNTNRLRNRLLDRVGPRASGPQSSSPNDPVQKHIQNITRSQPGGPAPPHVQNMMQPPNMNMMDPAAMMMLQQQMMGGGGGPAFPPNFEAMMMGIQQMGQLAMQMGLVPGMNPMMVNGGGSGFGGPGGQSVPQQGGQRRSGSGLGGKVNNGQAPPAAPTQLATAPTIQAPTPVTPVTAAAPTAPARPVSPTLCKFVTNCNNPTCRYSHPSPVATVESGVVLSTDPCEKGLACDDNDCIYSHVSKAAKNAYPAPPVVAAPPTPTVHQIPCKFDPNCTRPNCPYSHPSHTKRPIKPRPNHSGPTSSTACKFGSGCTRADCPYGHPLGRVLPSQFSKGLNGAAPSTIAANETTERATWNKSLDFRAKTTQKRATLPDHKGLQDPKVVSGMLEFAQETQRVGSPRGELVSKLYVMLNRMGVIQIRGTPASGKTTLATLLLLHIKEQSSKTSPIKVFWGYSWPTREEAREDNPEAFQTDYERRLSGTTGWPGLPERGDATKYYIILDEAQDTYWDFTFWDFLKRCQDDARTVYVALFCAYGSSSHLSNPNTPPMIGPDARIGLQPSGSTENRSLLLTWNEYEELRHNPPEPLSFEKDLHKAIYAWTNGHIGAVKDMLSVIALKAKKCNANGRLYTMRMFTEEWPVFGLLATKLAGYPNFGRGFPDDHAIRQKAVVFQQLIQEEHIDIPSNESSPDLNFCEKKGWVYANSQADRIRYTFPSPLHRACLSWKLVVGPVTLDPNLTILDLSLRAIRGFSSFQVKRCARKVGGGSQDSTPEALYQDEFYRSLYKEFNGSVNLGPEFASASGASRTGRIDFFLPQYKWGIECMRDGSLMNQHVERFGHQEAYGQWLLTGDMKDWIVLDFRGNKPSTRHPGINHLYHVVFSENGEMYEVYDTQLMLIEKGSLLARIS